MILPKLTEGERNNIKDALKAVPDQDVLDFLEQKVTFDDHGWEQKCLAKLYALLYKHDEEITSYENSLNDMTEKAENLETASKQFLKEVYKNFGQNIELWAEAQELEKAIKL